MSAVIWDKTSRRPLKAKQTELPACFLLVSAFNILQPKDGSNIRHEISVRFSKEQNGVIF
jgi:hypothetical protein